MPDINLLKDTERLEGQSPKPPRRPGELPLSTPPTEHRGFSGVWRSLFNRPAAAPPPPSNKGKMSLGRTTAGERILSETKKAGPAVIPLPDEESYNVNLLTEELVGTFSPQRKLIELGLIALGAMAVVALLYGGLVWYEQTVSKQVSATRQELQAVKTQISARQDKQQQMVSTSKKIAAIQGLIDRHVRWTKFFERLEHYTLPSVTYGTVFTGDVQGELTFAAKTDTYEHVAAQYLVLQQAVANHDFIRSFSLTGAQRIVVNNVETVEFTVGLTLEPALLENAPTAVAASTTQP